MSEQWQPPRYDPRQHQRHPQDRPLQDYPPPGYPYAQPPPPPQPAPKPGPKYLRGCLTLIVLAAVIGTVIAVTAHGGGSGGSYRANLGDFNVINPADLAVTVHVTNTGRSAGTPTCKVQASDPSGAYFGFDEGTLTSPVRPGQTVTYVDNVTITHEGAQYVTNVTVSC